MHLVAVKKGLTLVVLVGLTAATAACGSSKSASSSSSTTPPATSSTPAASSNVAAAEQAIAPYVGKPAPFPVTEPLKKSVRGKTVAYLNVGNPINTLLYNLSLPAAKILGIKLSEVKAGQSAATVGSAFDSVVAMHPDGVMVPGINPELWTKQLKELQAAKIPIVASAILNGPQFGLGAVEGSAADDARSGKLMADYVIAKMDPHPNVAVYSVPEVPAIGAVSQAFTAELKQLCPACQSRTVQIPAATLGSTAPNAVVSDLQSHSGTTVAVFSDDEVELGLPQALKSAGITIKTLGYAPGPANLEYLKAGKETAVLADDLAVSAWTQMDQMARELGGQALTGPEAQGLDVVQFLTPSDVTFNPSKGWTGYPDFAPRFAKLWGAAK